MPDRAGAATLVIATLLAGASCSSSGVSDTDASAGPPSPLGTINSSTPTPPMSTPFITCDGLKDVADAVTLVESGKATAFIEAQVGKPLAESDYDRSVAVDDYTLLAGKLLAGPVMQLQLEPVVDDFDPFPPGRYYLLVGPIAEETAGDYFVTNGLRGSFLADGDNLRERCPNYEDPTSPQLVRDGTTDRKAVVNLFDKAFSQTGSLSPSTS